MRVALMTEDRDTGYLFLNVREVPEGAVSMSISLEGVDWQDAVADDSCVWLIGITEENKDQLRVVDKLTYHSNSDEIDEEWFPIPAPRVLFDAAEYQRMI